MNNIALELLAEDKRIITYRPRFARELGSVKAAILLQQIYFRWYYNNQKPFYKFRSPCGHNLYRDGDSWSEELGFTEREFDLALRRIALKIKAADLDKTQDEKLIYYWTDITRATWYTINPVAFSGFIQRAYGEVGNRQNVDFEIDKTDSSYIVTKNTTEKTKHSVPKEQEEKGSKKLNKRQQFTKELAEQFVAAFPDPSRRPVVPNPTTQKAMRSIAVSWWNPLMEIYTLTRPDDERSGSVSLMYDEDSLTFATDLIHDTVDVMIERKLTIADPRSIVKVATSLWMQGGTTDGQEKLRSA